MVRKLSLFVAIVLSALASTGLMAAQRTLISDYTGLDCSVNSNGAAMYSAPSKDSQQLWSVDDGTPVHILGGKQVGVFIAFPNTDEEFARTWLKVKLVDSSGKPTGVVRWVQSGSINCGG